MSQNFNNFRNNDYVNESFSVNYADAYGKELAFDDNNLNETVLEQKMKKMKKENVNTNLNDTFSLFNQFNYIDFENDNLNITIQDKQKDDYLYVRKFPSFTENEYQNIKRSVSGNLLEVQSYLFRLNMDYTEISVNKKVGPLLPLTYVIENQYSFKKEHAKEIQEKYERLKYNICNYRTIYGDGNCYYRAVIFRYIELLIINKKTDIIKMLIIDIYKSFQSQEIKQRLKIENNYLNAHLIIQIMITILELVESNRIEEAHLSFYKALLFSKIFDYSLILYLRYIIYAYIKENEKKLYLESFPVLIGNLLPSEYEVDGRFDFNSFYQTYLLKMFVCAEKIIIYLTPFVLGINVSCILFDDQEKEIVKTFGFAGKSQVNIEDTIFVLNRRGHYENIYSL